MNANLISEITLYRGPCLGDCPVFRFTANRQSQYNFEGRLYVDPLGVKQGHFPSFMFDRLAEACIELRVLELDDHYPTDWDDLPSVDVSIKFDSTIKHIRSDGGDNRPTRLWAIAELIEVSMREAMNCEKRKKT